MSNTPESDTSALFDFVAQYLNDIDQGVPKSLIRYLTLYPGHEERVAREYLKLEGKGPPSSLSPSPTSARPSRLGPYRVLRELGRGGQGVVLLAEDPEEDLCVALKVLSAPLGYISDARRKRLEREATVVSRLNHPGICEVYDAQLEGETPFIAMRFVEGETLATLIHRERKAPASSPPSSNGSSSGSFPRVCRPTDDAALRGTLRLFERAARALHAAHEAGVVHRDVKPGNIMVTPEGAPVLLDFGLARDDESERATLTLTGETFGTPPYMSPEQVAPSGKRLGPRSDVYSLGAALYEALTLHPPYDGNPVALAEDIRNKPLPDPRRLNPAVPFELKVVLEKAMEKDPARRYATALAFAEDLRRLRVAEPTFARPASWLRRARSWMRRNRTLALSGSAILLALSTALVISQVSLSEVRRERNEKDAALRRSISALLRDRAATMLPMDPGQALLVAMEAVRREPGPEGHRTLLACLEALQSKKELIGHAGRVVFAGVSRDGERIVTASKDGTARIWDADTGEERLRLEGHEGAVRSAAFNTSGDRVVTASDDLTARIWDLESGASLVLEGHVHAVHWAEFHPDGSRVVTASDDGTVRLWDAAEGTCELVLQRCDLGPVVPEGADAEVLFHFESEENPKVEDYRDTRRLTKARFNEDGTRVYSVAWGEQLAGHDCPWQNAVLVWDARTGERLFELSGNQESITDLAVSRDEAYVATTSFGGRVLAWDLTRGERDVAPRSVLEVSAKTLGLTFLSDSRLAVVYDPTAEDPLARRSGATIVGLEADELLELGSHGNRAVAGVAHAPGSKRLATIAFDGSLRLWGTEHGAPLGVHTGGQAKFEGVCWSPDESWLLTWGRYRARIWYGEERPFLRRFEGHTGPVTSARFDPAGGRIVTASLDGTARVWDRSSGATLATLASAPRAPLNAARFSPDGRRILLARRDGSAELWDAHTYQPIRELTGHSAELVSATFHPTDPELVFTASRDGTACLWDLETGHRKRFRAHDTGLTCARLDATGERMVTGGRDRTVKLWNTSVTRPLESDEDIARPRWNAIAFTKKDDSLNAVWDVNFSPDGSYLVVAGQNSGVSILDAHKGSLVSSWSDGVNFGALLFANKLERGLVATDKWAGGVRIWPIARDAAGVLRPDPTRTSGPPAADAHTSSVTCITRVGSDVLATGALDGTAKLWRMDSTSLSIIGTFRHDDAILDIDQSPDGLEILTASVDGKARLWPVDLLSVAEAYQPYENRTIVENVLRAGGLATDSEEQTPTPIGD